MNIMDLIDIISLMVVGVSLGWFARERYAVYQVRRLMNDAVADKLENIQPAIPIVIEKEGDMFYVYDEETREFLAQGVDHETVASVLNKRFPTRSFTAQPQNLQEVGYKVTRNDAV